MGRNIHCTFVSEKISKIRWRPSTLSEPNCFASASWDNSVNNIRLWEIRPTLLQQEDNSEDQEINPCEIRDVPLKSDITQLKFISSDGIIASTSDGSVYYFKITSNEQYEIDICQEIHWDCLHKLNDGFPSSCTSFATYDNDIASVGEDGKIKLLSVNNKNPTGVIADADSCTIQCIEFLRYNELITANTRGLLKIWDMRNNMSNKPMQSFLLRDDAIIGITALAYHPTQRHIVMVGDETGSITVYDMRQNTYPVNVMQQHQEAVNEIVFHQDRPDQFFSCGGGDVYHWTGLKQSSLNGKLLWYLMTGGLNKYDIFRLMPELHVPVNSIDLSRDKLLCGADNEAMYLIENVNVYNLYSNESVQN